MEHNVKKGIKESTNATTIDAFYKLKEYLQAEVINSAEDLTLLENVNNEVQKKYQNLIAQTQLLVSQASKAQHHFKEIDNCITRVNDLHGQILELEALAKEIESYAQHLEKKFMQYLDSN